MNEISDKVINGSIYEFIRWNDTDGKIINASDGGMIFVDGIYYWYGMALRPLPYGAEGCGGQVTETGVVMYSSKDLYEWKYEGVILPCTKDIGTDLYGPMRMERPKIIYNKTTNKYVLWCHYVKYPGDHGSEIGTAEAGVAVCDSVNGIYQWLGYTRPIDKGGLVEDFTLYKDCDEKAYFIYDRQTKDENYIHIVRLSDDYLSFTNDYVKVNIMYKREAPAVVHYGKYYYMLTSGLTGWAYNQAKYYRSLNIMGPWEDMGDPCIEDEEHTTFRSQGTYIFKVEDAADTYIFMAERHNVQNFEECSYVWLPIKFNKDHTLSLEYLREWCI